MKDYIVLIIFAVLFIIGIIYTVKHFKGESGCCGSGGYKPKKKKLKNVLYKKNFRIGGMTCEHCKNRVEETVNDIKGVAGRVDLKKGELTILYAEEVDDLTIKRKIEKAGYTVL